MNKDLKEKINAARDSGIHESMIILSQLKGLSESNILNPSAQKIVDDSLYLINQYQGMLRVALKYVPDNPWKYCVMPYATGLTKNEI